MPASEAGSTCSRNVGSDMTEHCSGLQSAGQVPMKPTLLATLKSNNYLLNCLLAMSAQERVLASVASTARAMSICACPGAARKAALLFYWPLQERGGCYGINIRSSSLPSLGCFFFVGSRRVLASSSMAN